MTLVVRVYQLVFSPVLHALMPGFGCRYLPTCSDYARHAFSTFPLHVALVLVGKRLLSCHPFHKGSKT